jgi:DNA modification methylase
MKHQSSMALARGPVERAYRTSLGEMLVGRIEDALLDNPLRDLIGKVDLILTSPPFPLVTKKRYGNETGIKYVAWLSALAPQLADLLSPNGSIVVEVGNAWIKGSPTMSTLPLEALLAFRNAAGLHLCQHIICHNPARLPGPAAWVNVERVRLKDSYTHLWWMSRTEWPKADNRNVLLPYSKDMQKLLQTQRYNSGQRPSGHKISAKGFLRNHEGSISANVISIDPSDSRLPTSLLRFGGTGWDAKYRAYCNAHGLEKHPARMQPELAAFFVRYLTDSNDLVVDPFSGSNTTGAIAEALGRRWISVDAEPAYAEGSKGRFAEFNGDAANQPSSLIAPGG